MKKALTTLGLLALCAAPAFAAVDLTTLKPLLSLEEVKAASGTKTADLKENPTPDVIFIGMTTDKSAVATLGEAKLPALTYAFSLPPEAKDQQDKALCVGWRGAWTFPTLDAAMKSENFQKAKAWLEKNAKPLEEGEFQTAEWHYSLAVAQAKDGRGIFMASATINPDVLKQAAEAKAKKK